MIGAITSVGGGVIRDMLAQRGAARPETRRAQRRGAVLGATTYVMLVEWLNFVKPIAMTACVLLVIALRVLAERRGWQAPVPRDLTPVVTGLMGGRPSVDEWAEGEEAVESEEAAELPESYR